MAPSHELCKYSPSSQLGLFSDPESNIENGNTTTIDNFWALGQSENIVKCLDQ